MQTVLPDLLDQPAPELLVQQDQWGHQALTEQTALMEQPAQPARPGLQDQQGQEHPVLRVRQGQQEALAHLGQQG